MTSIIHETERDTEYVSTDPNEQLLKGKEVQTARFSSAVTSEH